MTFTGEIREELARQESETAGEAEYEWYGAGLACGGAPTTRHALVARRFLALARRHPERFGECVMEKRADARFGGRVVYALERRGPAAALSMPETTEHAAALLRGAFLARGAAGGAEGRCHLSIGAADEQAARELQRVMADLGVQAGASPVRGRWQVYLRRGDAIGELLGRMGATNAFLKLESGRVMKEMRVRINRQVNCDSANIRKTQEACERQIEVVEYIRRELGLDKLPASLEEIARLRLDNPVASLEELGAMTSPPVGKSGASSRLRRLQEIARKLREKETRDG